jgi:hypothetical protein
MQKKIKLHHSVTELGNLQVRQVFEYVDETGEVLNRRYIDPYTPQNPSNMEGFDVRSKEIVEAITDPKVLKDFKAEKQEKTGVGIEEIVTYDRVVEPGRIAVRRITRVFDDGIEVSKKYHRSWISPGDDLSKADVISAALARKLLGIV